MATYMAEACSPLAWQMLPGIDAYGEHLETWHVLASAETGIGVITHLFEHPKHPGFDGMAVYATVEQTHDGARLMEAFDANGNDLLPKDLP